MEKLLNCDEQDEDIEEDTSLIHASWNDTLKEDCVQLLLLTIGNALYLFIGGLVFYAIEHTPRKEFYPKQQVQMLLEALQVRLLCF